MWGSEGKKLPGGSCLGPARALPWLCWGQGALFLHAPPQICPVPNGPAKPWGPEPRSSTHESPLRRLRELRHKPCQHRAPRAASQPRPDGSRPAPPRDVGAPCAHHCSPQGSLDCPNLEFGYGDADGHGAELSGGASGAFRGCVALTGVLVGWEVVLG